MEYAFPEPSLGSISSNSTEVNINKTIASDKLFISGEDLCIQALSEANGTILCRQPIIAQFARDVDIPRLDNNR